MIDNLIEQLMQKLKFIIHSALLVTTSTLLACPQDQFSQVNAYTSIASKWTRPTTYDEILQMLDNLESGLLESTYSPIDLERINLYLAIVAKEGILPNELNEEAVLQEDTYDLMCGEDNPFLLACNPDYTYALVEDYAGYQIIQCGKISKAWHKTKKFVKKHKKSIIIGAALAVAATVVIALVAASSAGAAVAGAAGAAAAGADSFDSKGHKSPPHEDPQELSSNTIDDIPETPILKAAENEQFSFYKEFLIEDKTAYPEEPTEQSFLEKIRETGAHITHKAYDEITSLVSVVPELCAEVKTLVSYYLPSSLIPSHEDAIDPIENYEMWVARGHDVIDRVFSTDQAELFTPEAKSHSFANNFAIGMIPLPSTLSQFFSRSSQLIENGKVLDRAGYTKAGRSLMKHGYRKDSVFPKPLGNPQEINEHGQKTLESIINHPEKTISYKQTKHLGDIVDIHAPGIGGVRYKASGELIGFLEPKK
ncbi:MAG: hypothetical protein RLZZ453_777 [Chlamydiota bacterium]|jgi:hypothetical protein